MNTTPKPIRVAVTGAAGQIGYALIFRIASGQMFGPNQPVILQLLELEAALPSLQGVVMELHDCAFPLLHDVIATADVNVAMRDADYAILVGSMPRKDGMERSDLLNLNGKIFSVQGKAINENAKDHVRVFVVGNPCNTNCLIAMHHAPRIPRNQFYAMTLLDELRARAQLALKAGVTMGEVSRMVIWGNHSATQFPDFYHARIQGKPVTDVISDLNWLQNSFIPTIQQRGAAVIKARGASSAASAANAALGTIYRLVHDTPDNEAFSVAFCSSGEYGIDEGLIFSMPVRTQNKIVQVLKDWTHDEFAQNKIHITLEELRKERDAVFQLGLIQ